MKLPPPILVGGLCALAWLLEQFIPLHFVPAFSTSGWIAMLAGLALAGWTVVVMVQAKTNPRPDRPDQVLVETGPFLFSRNPIYLGFVLIAVGLALRSGDVWPWLAAAASLAGLHWLVVNREEPYLRQRFGAAYEDYSRRVNRWV